MASISTDSNGNRRVLFFDLKGKRPALHLGKMPMKQAESFLGHFEDLLSARKNGLSLEGRTTDWLGRLAPAMLDRLADLGLIEKRVARVEQECEAPVRLLGEFLDAHIEGRRDVKEWTREVYRGTRNRLLKYVSAETPLSEVTKAVADAFVIHLKSSERKPGKRYSAATVARDVKRCREFFAAAVRAELIEENPFTGIRGGAMDNPDRAFFVPREWAAAILDACPDAEWRAIFALARFGGLRVPSELQRLTWDDIDWHKNVFHVHSPKLEHTRKARRVVPLFPELRPHLELLDQRADSGSVYVIPRARNREVNLRTQFQKIIKRAGLTPWERLFQNLRATRETELARQHPLHVVTAWIGNSAKVAVDHYLQVTDEDVRRAVETSDAESDAQATQNPTQHASVHSRQGSQKTQKTPAIAGVSCESGSFPRVEQYPRQDSNL